MRLAIATIVLAVASAHADPPRLSLHGDVKPVPRLRLERAPRVDHGIDEVLALAIDRVTHIAGKVVMRRGVGPYVHVENAVTEAHAPRTIVIGIQFGALRVR